MENKKIKPIDKIEGLPKEKLICERCGSEMKCVGNIYKEGKFFTEWRCPKCVKVTW